MIFSDIHIDDFYRDTAKILLTLYMHFPRKMSLYVEDISGPDEQDEFGLHSPRHQATLHAMMWLAHAGYLDYDSLIRQEALENAVLSHRGFLTLNSPLEKTTDNSIDLKEADDNNSSAENEEKSSEFPALMANLDDIVVNHLRQELKEGNSYSLAELLRQVMLLSRKYS